MPRQIGLAPGRSRAFSLPNGVTVRDDQPVVVSDYIYAALDPYIANGTLIDLGASDAVPTTMGTNGSVFDQPPGGAQMGPWFKGTIAQVTGGANRYPTWAQHGDIGAGDPRMPDLSDTFTIDDTDDVILMHTPGLYLISFRTVYEIVENTNASAIEAQVNGGIEANWGNALPSAPYSYVFQRIGPVPPVPAASTPYRTTINNTYVQPLIEGDNLTAPFSLYGVGSADMALVKWRAEVFLSLTKIG